MSDVWWRWWLASALWLLFSWWCLGHAQAQFTTRATVTWELISVGEDMAEQSTIALVSAGECGAQIPIEADTAVVVPGWTTLNLVVSCAEMGALRISAEQDGRPISPLTIQEAHGGASAVAWFGSVLEYPIAGQPEPQRLQLAVPTEAWERVLFTASFVQDAGAALPALISHAQEVKEASSSGEYASAFGGSCRLESALLWGEVARSNTCWLSASSLAQPVQTAVLARAPSQTGELVISEVMWAGMWSPLVNVAADEWFELANTTDEALILTGVQLVRGQAQELVVTLPEVTLAPQHYLVVARRPSTTSLLGKQADVVIPGFSLHNDVADLRLLTAEGGELDRLPSGGWQAGFTDSPTRRRASAQRLQLAESGSQWSNWGHCSLADALRCDILYNATTLLFPANNWATPWQPSLL